LTKLLSKRTDLELYGLDRKAPQLPVKEQARNDITMPRYFLWQKDFEFDCVIHLAAEVAVGRSVTNPIVYYKTNTLGTLRVLQDLTCKRFIHASTGSAGPMNNPYGISKRASEEIVDQYCRERSIPFTTFRFYNVTGVDGFPPTNPDGLMSSLMRAQDTGIFYVYGGDYNTPDGSAIRDYTHVNEICAALVKAIDDPANSLENLGHGVGTSVIEMVKLYKEINSCDFRVEIKDRRPGDLEISVLDNVSRYMEKLYDIKDLLKNNSF
jgi:UDP-glucose 4-epimerase